MAWKSLEITKQIANPNSYWADNGESTRDVLILDATLFGEKVARGTVYCKGPSECPVSLIKARGFTVSGRCSDCPSAS